MKKINSISLSFIYAGCFLGAGFISGQELWQFFGSFGVWGYMGFGIAVSLFVVFGIIMLRLTQMTGYQELERIMVPWEKLHWLRRVAGCFTSVYLFGIVIVMAAGVGAMVQQLFHVPAWLGSAVYSIVLTVVALLGVTGMVSVFSLLIPVLVGATVVFGVLALCRFDPSRILQIQPSNDNPLMSNWLVAALTFVSYNILGSIGIMMPLGEHLGRDKRVVNFGILLGGIELVFVAASIVASVVSLPGSEAAQLPMVAVATQISRVAGGIYGVMLVMAMFTNALGTLVGLCDHLEQRHTALQKRRRLYIPALVLASWLGSLFGFSDTVGVLFPIFGYISSVFVAAMVVHYFQARKKHSKNA